MAIVLFALGSACGGGGKAEPELEGVAVIRVDSRDHTDAEVDYDHVLPAGGMHNRVWANCGFYDEEMFPELAVHSLEHGAVWIAYDPALSRADQEVLHDLARADDKLLVSPVEGMAAPVVATAWARQLELDSVTDPLLEQFIDRYRDASTAPESGGYCSGAYGEPVP